MFKTGYFAFVLRQVINFFDIFYKKRVLIVWMIHTEKRDESRHKYKCIT